MNISVLLSIVNEMYPDRLAVCDDHYRWTYDDLDKASTALAGHFLAGGHDKVAMIDTNSVAFPAVFFAAAKAGIPFVCLNYRLSDERLRAQVTRLEQVLVVTDEVGARRVGDLSNAIIALREELLAGLDSGQLASHPLPADETGAAACWLFTSGTTGEPKIVVLAHENLSSYVLGTVDPGSADEGQAVLVSVPPYHIAGMAAVLSSVFAGRRMFYLESFTPESWVQHAQDERITQAMVVPTMLQRVLDTIESNQADLSALQHLSYGGGRMPQSTIEQALGLLPHVGFTNAYGLTETSSTIALLGPEDHRLAIASGDPVVRQRLGSVGAPVPGIEVEIRDDSAQLVATGERGEIWVRGPQVSGQYLGKGSGLVDGWFCTKDQGWIDSDGYLYLLGRMDDVIVRGGENLSPGEIEDVLRTHPSVEDVAVVGQPDDEWGEVPVAVIVLKEHAVGNSDELSSLVRAKLRSSRLPARYHWVQELPYNETGKLLRLAIREMLSEASI